MTKPDYDYYGLLASTWDLGRGDTSNWSDRPFFLDFVRRYGEPALDIGCGTGRILLDSMAKGIDIDGLDNSPELLAICRSKAAAMHLSPTLYEQRMETLALPRTYRTILAPSSAFQLVTGADAARETLRRFYDHLEPGGAFISPFAFDWREGDPLESEWRLRFEKQRSDDGATVRAWSREWHEPDRQLWHAEDRFEVERDGAVVEAEHQRRSPEGRWYTQAQATALFREVGFAEIRLFHGFTHEPVREDDRLFCVLGVKG